MPLTHGLKSVNALARRVWISWPLVLSVGAWAILFGPSLAAHVLNSSDPLLFNDDVRQQVWPFFRYYNPGSFPDDFIGTYYLHAFFPIGYRAVFTVLACLADPASVSKVVPYVCLTVTVIACALAARRLGGAAAFFATGALCLSSYLPLDRMAGGLPRAFGLPIVALGLYALVAGRPRLMAGAVILGAAFYPPAAVAPGIAMLVWFFAMPFDTRVAPATASLKTRLGIVAGTAACSALLLLPSALGGRAYGRLITPSDIAVYPEAGPDGRYFPGDRAPFPNLLPEVVNQTVAAFYAHGEPFVASVRSWTQETGERHRQALVYAFLIFASTGYAALAVRDRAARRVLALAFAAGVSFLLAKACAPYLFLPQRHLVYTIPVLIWVVLPSAAAALGNLIPVPTRAVAPACALAMAGVVLVFVGGRVSPREGLTVQVPASERIYSFLATLPQNALIAGWPAGVMDNVPYLSRRQILLSSETHQAFHSAYADEMRHRMHALTDAIFAVDETPLIRLRDGLHVTHLIVDLDQLGVREPTYFSPFTTEIRSAHDRGARQGFIVPILLPACAVFREGTLAVLDLSKLDSSELLVRTPG